MSSRSTLALVTVVSAASTSGCYATWDIEPRTLATLDGFREGQTVVLESTQMEAVTFSRDTSLHFKGKDGREIDAKFRAIQVQGPILVGETQDQGLLLNVDLNRMDTVQAKNFSKGQTAALATGIVAVGVPVTVVGAFFAAFGLFGGGIGGGRPLRVPGRTAPVRAPLFVARGHRRSHGMRRMDDTTRSRLLAHWAQEASAECASVPAFLAIARDLTRVSAPRALVNAALRAAREEITHTRLCTALANVHSDDTIAAIPPPVPVGADIDRASLLERLVLEAFWDGCVAEGGAAAEAQRSLATADDETTRLALQTIAHDEQGHADLAREIMTFGLSAGGPAVRRALMESFEKRRSAEEAQLDQDDVMNESAIDEDAARAFGLAGAAIERASRVQAWEKSVAMLAQI